MEMLNPWLNGLQHYALKPACYRKCTGAVNTVPINTMSVSTEVQMSDTREVQEGRYMLQLTEMSRAT